MTRVTVEGCLDSVGNCLKLIILATKCIHQLAAGGKEPKVAWGNDKPTVVAPCEIASGLVSENVVQQEDIVEDEPLFAAFDDEADTEAL